MYRRLTYLPYRLGFLMIFFITAGLIPALAQSETGFDTEQLSKLIGEMRTTSAEIAEDNKQLDEALALRKEATECDPSNAGYWYHYGRLLFKVERYQEAEDPCRHAVKLDPSCATYWNVLGNVLRAMKKIQDADTAYHKATELSPSNAIYWNNLGENLTNLGRGKEAESALYKALELAPIDIVILYNIGCLRSRQKQWEQALEWFRKALHVDPRYYLAWEWSAFAYANKKDTANALYALRQTIKGGEKYRKDLLAQKGWFKPILDQKEIRQFFARLQSPEWVHCNTCRGWGYILQYGRGTCRSCGGSGTRTQLVLTPPGSPLLAPGAPNPGYKYDVVQCGACGGSGREIVSRLCKVCRGTGGYYKKSGR